VLKGNADSSSSCPFEPDPGAERYEVASALACQVIGPLSPATWKLTASLLPGAAPGRATASLQTDWPGRMVTAVCPEKRTAWVGPARTAPLLKSFPAKTPSSITGLVPKALENRSRAWRVHRSGMTIRRNV